jgi:hypothetical protein
VKITASIAGAALDKMGATLAHKMSWTAACWVLGMVAITGAIRLLCEWQRRLTLVAIVQHAAGGTVVIQERGLGGPAMWVQVGSGSPWTGTQQSGIPKPGHR